MKLRDRKKRVLDHIKQEDDKPDLTLINASSSTVNVSSSWNRGIKQEDTKNDSNLPQQDHGFGEGKDYYYRCDICKQRMPTVISVLQHRKLIHNLKRTHPSKIKDINTEPDIHDPNFYCKSCKVDYNDRKGYRQHLKSAHYMVLKPIPSHQIPQNSIVPDPDDPNLYCRACDHTYSSKTIYKQHCRCTHGITSVKIANTRAKRDGIIDTYCKPCDIRLSSKGSYKSHLFAIHNVDWRLIHKKRKNTVPNIDDPNFYCCACERKLASKGTFKIHLMTVHAIYQSAPKKTSLEPDINDPNNYCCTCQKTYSLKSRYRTHLRLVHQIVLPPLIGNADPGKLPDPNDPQNYCKVCRKSLITRKMYRAHCRRVHIMKLDHYNIFNRNAMIDINHPEFYCAQCERSYSSKQSFRMHLRNVHNT